MILKGTSDIDPIDIHMKQKELYKVYRGEDLVWQRTPDTLTGYVMYYGALGGTYDDQPMKSTTVYILDEDKVQINSCAVNGTTGYFEFTDRSELHQTRYVKVSTDYAFGGLSATDSQAILLREDDTPPAYWTPVLFMDEAGDVNGDGAVTSVDADAVSDRLLYPDDPDYYFKDADGNLRDWVFFLQTNNTDGGRLFIYDSKKSGIIDYRKNKTMNIWTRCYGDITGSHNIS